MKIYILTPTANLDVRDQRAEFEGRSMDLTQALSWHGPARCPIWQIQAEEQLMSAAAWAVGSADGPRAASHSPHHHPSPKNCIPLYINNYTPTCTYQLKYYPFDDSKHWHATHCLREEPCDQSLMILDQVISDAYFNFWRTRHDLLTCSHARYMSAHC